MATKRKSIKIQNLSVRDVQEAAAYIEKPFYAYTAPMIKAVVTVLAGGKNPFSIIKFRDSRETCHFLVGKMKEELQRQYPTNLHRRIIDQIKQDLPNLITEAKEQTAKENAFEEWANLASNKSANEIRSMIYKFKRA
jgi:signal recognition particle receptor subunit beta